MAGRYNLEKIQSLLNAGFTDEELRQLCFDISEFRPVYNRISPNTPKSSIISTLLEYANQTFQIETILIWAKANNPVEYQRNAPYFEIGIRQLKSSRNWPAKSESPGQEKPTWLLVSLYLIGTLIILSVGFGLFLIVFS